MKMSSLPKKQLIGMEMVMMIEAPERDASRDYCPAFPLQPEVPDKEQFNDPRR